MELNVKRYGAALFKLDTNNLRNGLIELKNTDFAYFLDADLNDDVNVNQIKDFISDTSLITIYNKSNEVYPNNDKLNADFTLAFRYFNYYFPNIKLPEVYTYISGLQYENPIWIQDSVMVIAIDVYLGSEFAPYSGLGLPRYKIMCMRPENMLLDVMKHLYDVNIASRRVQKTLLERMVGAGKLLYYLDRVMPETADSIKMCYTQDQLNWAVENESNVWAFIIQNDLLYSTDYKSQAKLMIDAPFTTGFSRQSPSRLGAWLGLQIVRDYMRNNPNTSLQDLFLITDSQELLHKSGYKP